MKIKGLIAAPVTPFKKNGNISPETIGQYADFLKKQGIAGVFVSGTTGEGFSLTDNERKIMTEAWCLEKSTNFKVIIHVGHTSQKSSQDLAQHAEKFAADAIGEMGPIFFKPANVNQLVNYCANTAQVTSLPYYYYHMPSMNDLDFKMTDFLEMADNKITNLAGIKYTHFDLEDYGKCLNFNSGKYDLLFGRDEKLINSLEKNAAGAVGSTYNCFGPLYLDLIKAFQTGNFSRAQKLQNRSIAIIEKLAANEFFSALRHALKIQGLETGKVRAPLGELSSEQKDDLEKSLDELYFQPIA